MCFYILRGENLPVVYKFWHLKGAFFVQKMKGEMYMEYAGFWRRFWAYLIDCLIVGVANAIFISAKMPYAVLFIGWLYYALMESSNTQATVGKMALGLYVTDLNGNKIGFGRATGRYFGKIVSSIILCIGFMMAGWTAKKQALHDMMAGTLVLKRT